MVIAPLQSADCKTRNRERRFPLLGFSSLFVNIERHGKQEIKVDDNVDDDDDFNQNHKNPCLCRMLCEHRFQGIGSSSVQASLTALDPIPYNSLRLCSTTKKNKIKPLIPILELLTSDFIHHTSDFSLQPSTPRLLTENGFSRSEVFLLKVFDIQ